MHKTMNWNAVSFDWNLARAFLATVEEGSLSAAARALGLTQPTLSRQISILESNLGVLLLERGTRGMTLTDPGKELLEHVQAMGKAATQLSLVAAGQSSEVEGDVRLTSTAAFATYHLPPMLRRLRQMAPMIHIEIITSNQVRDITRRDADIAVRHAAPTQDDLIGKHVGEMPAHLYASNAFLDRVGRPSCKAELAGMDFIGFETRDRMLPMFHAHDIPVSEDNFKITTASGTTILSLIQHGLGVGVLTHDVEFMFPDLEKVLPKLVLAPVPIWLVTHRELRTNRRIRLTFDVLEEELREKFAGT